MKHLLLVLLGLATPAWSGAASYVLDAGGSSVAFTATAQGFEVTGTLPVTVGRARIDLEDLGASKIDVTVATTRIRTGFLPATSAIKSADLLDAATYPEVRFEVRSITREGNSGTVVGDLTIKSVTRPVTLQAQFVRTTDIPVDDLKRLGVQLTGTVDRRDFDVLGYQAFVHNTIAINVTAWLDRVER